MAGFRKKRRVSGPSKNDEKVMRGKRDARGGAALDSRFPSVKHLTLKVVFLYPSDNVMAENTVSFSASDASTVSFPCPGRCGRGSFDLTLKLKGVTDSGHSQAKFSDKCKEVLYTGSATMCDCEFRCEASIDYKPEPAPSPEPQTL